MSTQKAIVQRYTDGTRAGDLAMVVSCLSDHVVWAPRGDRTLVGKAAFAAEAYANSGTPPELHLDRLIEEGDSVVAVGHGSADTGGGHQVDFVYSEVFTFARGQVSRVDTFRVWLGAADEGLR